MLTYIKLSVVNCKTGPLWSLGDPGLTRSEPLRATPLQFSELYNISGVRTRVQKVKPKMAEFEEL